MLDTFAQSSVQLLQTQQIVAAATVQAPMAVIAAAAIIHKQGHNAAQARENARDQNAPKHAIAESSIIVMQLLSIPKMFLMYLQPRLHPMIACSTRNQMQQPVIISTGISKPTIASSGKNNSLDDLYSKPFTFVPLTYHAQ